MGNACPQDVPRMFPGPLSCIHSYHLWMSHHGWKKHVLQAGMVVTQVIYYAISRLYTAMFVD